MGGGTPHLPRVPEDLAADVGRITGCCQGDDAAIRRMIDAMIASRIRAGSVREVCGGSPYSSNIIPFCSGYIPA
jgi:hypothetical protein